MARDFGNRDNRGAGQGRPRSTIGADRLSFRVRNVTGRFTIAMTAETLWSYNG